jgi:pyruvate dehydrogenase E2 component (dihydrolipoamide acetyltransferase)
VAVEVILPKVDMDMASGKIARWFVAEGEAVAKGAPLFEIETDKAAMDVEAPASGILRAVKAGQGMEIPVGEVVAWIYGEGESFDRASPGPALAEAPDSPPEGDSRIIAAEFVESLVGGNGIPAHNPGAASSVKGKLRATPLARRIARQHGLDLSAVAGSGPNGRIQSRDVEALRPAGATSGPDAAAGGGSQAPEPIAKPPAAPPKARARDALASARTLNAEWLREGAGTPVVFLHGFGSELASWRPLLSGFDHDIGMLALDLPGHGRSVEVDVAGFDEMVALAEDALKSVGIGAAHLVGHSLGGAVATAIAAGGQLDVRSLLLLAPAGLGPEIDSAFIAGFGAATSEAAVRAWMSKLVANPSALSDGFVRAAARARADGRASAAQTRLGATLFPGNTQLFSTRGFFADFAMPTKVVVGLDDSIIPSHQALGLPGHIALHRFAATGHMPQMEQRQAVSRLLEELVT